MEEEEESERQNHNGDCEAHVIDDAYYAAMETIFLQPLISISTTSTEHFSVYCEFN